MAPRGVPWPSRGVPWPLYEEYALEDPYYIYLASSELAPNMFGASSELASVMEFGSNETVVDRRALPTAVSLWPPYGIGQAIIF